MNRRFTVALSFPGEHRKFVSNVADRLASLFGEERVLYDKYHDAEFARVDLDVYLPNLYRSQSELLVVFLCADYAAKRWCNLEWRSIRQLIATLDAKRIMFLSFGNPGDLSKLGILTGDGYIDILTFRPQTVVEKILKRLRINQGIKPPSSLPVSVPVDISRIIKYAPTELIGREEETKLLDDTWCKVQNQEPKRPHILTFVALGGEGKTSLVAKWAADLAHQGWAGCEAAFAWSFYHQGTDEKTADSSDLFLKEALIFFGDPTLADSAQGAYEKGRRLAQLVGARRALLILDGIEPLQYSPTSPTAAELKDAGLASLLKGLALVNHGLCLITTRYSAPDLKAFWQTTAPEKPLLRLSKEAGMDLLIRLGVRKESGFKAEFEELVEDVKGHALTLNLLGTYLRDAHAGDIRKRDLVKLEEADTEEQGGHAFRVIEAYVKSFESEGKNGIRALAILRLLGLFDRPATADCLKALLKARRIPNLTEALVGSTEVQRNLAFTRLNSAKLLTVNRDSSGSLMSLDAHPLIREYFSNELRNQRVAAWRAAHRRLYKHLIATTHEGDHPTLEDLQPLYQAVAHGCQAGMHQDVFEKVCYVRIWRGAEAYPVKKLGAFGSELGAIAWFFEQTWSRVSPSLPEHYQAFLLSSAAFCLRAMGQLIEALEPMRAGLDNCVKQEDWINASINASNLGELELTLGEVTQAVADAERAVTYADHSGEAFQRMHRRARLADAHHQAGRHAEAEAHFSEAEEMQEKSDPNYPLLYSLSGFQYCDLLLSKPLRAAWNQTDKAEVRIWNSELLDVCHAISERASKTLNWGEGKLDVLNIALNQLTLSRAALYEMILKKGATFEPAQVYIDQTASRDEELRNGLQPMVLEAAKHMDACMDGLRRAGAQHHIPRGLLTRAWLRSLTGVHIGPESAQTDLDEAWEIAERGPMRLHMTDIHLYRARLFHHVKPYPWTHPHEDLKAARKLMEQCGYWRRKEELEDAEAAAKNW